MITVLIINAVWLLFIIFDLVCYIKACKRTDTRQYNWRYLPGSGYWILWKTMR